MKIHRVKNTKSVKYDIKEKKILIRLENVTTCGLKLTKLVTQIIVKMVAPISDITDH